MGGGGVVREVKGRVEEGGGGGGLRARAMLALPDFGPDHLAGPRHDAVLRVERARERESEGGSWGSGRGLLLSQVCE